MFLLFFGPPLPAAVATSFLETPGTSSRRRPVPTHAGGGSRWWPAWRASAAPLRRRRTGPGSSGAALPRPTPSHPATASFASPTTVHRPRAPAHQPTPPSTSRSDGRGGCTQRPTPAARPHAGASRSPRLLAGRRPLGPAPACERDLARKAEGSRAWRFRATPRGVRPPLGRAPSAPAASWPASSRVGARAHDGAVWVARAASNHGAP